MPNKVLRYFTIFIILTFTLNLKAQHNGDNIYFQGIDNFQGNQSVKLNATGGLNFSGTNDINSIFGNPAGLLNKNQFEVYIGFNNYQKKYWENQDFRPNRQFVTMPFYLDGMYTPKPENNGKWDYDVFFDDSTYIVNDPKSGLDPYSEEAADWVEKDDDFTPSSFAVSVPFNLFDHQFQFAAAYYKNRYFDYDRNQTYMYPHIGYDKYGGLPERVTAAEDSVRINWYDYQRSRKGDIKNYKFALAAKISEAVNVGISAHYFSSDVDDKYILDKVGYFDLMGGANQFKFSYDTLNTSKTGTSEFSALRFSIGTSVKLSKIELGLLLNLPYTLERKFNYSTNVSSNEENLTLASSGKDEIEIPLSFAVGLSYQPLDNFKMSFNFSKTNYSEATYTMAVSDSLFEKTPNNYQFSIGVEYGFLEYFTLYGGYRKEAELFIPDGAANKDSGPVRNTYSLGLGIDTNYGQLQVAYVYSKSKYYDSYYSNTNYNAITRTNIMMGYQLNF